MKVSVVTTVLNEIDAIERLLESFNRQTRQPDEIVIVDGGSTDGTVEYLRGRCKQDPRLRLLVHPGANIAAGRNKAIAASKHDLIACTDAGVSLSERWLEELVRPIEADPAVDVVCGSFRADPQSDFETALGALTLPTPEEIEPAKFLPSSRSIAFKKSIWQAVGGYPEWIDYCEDLIFDLELKKRGYKFVYARGAEARFRPRSSVGSYFRQYYLYARGDGKANLWLKRHIIRYATYILAPLVVVLGFWYKSLWLALLVGGAIYLRRPAQRLWSATQGWPAGRRLRVFLLMPYLRLVGDVAKMIGYLAGVWWRLRRRRQS